MTSPPVSRTSSVETVTAVSGEPFDSLLDPKPHAAALAHEARLRAGEVKPAEVASSNIDYWVGPVGLEPTARGLKVRCSAN